MSQPACDGQKAACMDWFSLLSTMCVLGIELRSASLVTNVFTYCDTSLVHENIHTKNQEQMVT